ncbi:MAG TPA: response regulator [Nitrososphaeraceae archaeon]|jgi:DNA-binding NtrC family response regulator
MKRVLIVIDDDPQVTNNFKDALKVNGFAGDVVNDSLLALSLIRNNVDKYDNVFCDVRMPGMNGLELVEEIQKVKSTIGVVLMSSHAKDVTGHSPNLLRNNSIDFAIKPENIEGIVQLLSSVIK